MWYHIHCTLALQTFMHSLTSIKIINQINKNHFNSVNLQKYNYFLNQRFCFPIFSLLHKILHVYCHHKCTGERLISKTIIKNKIFTFTIIFKLRIYYIVPIIFFLNNVQSIKVYS